MSRLMNMSEGYSNKGNKSVSNARQIKKLIILDHRSVTTKNIIEDINSFDKKNNIYDSLKNIIKYMIANNRNKQSDFEVYIYCPFLITQTSINKKSSIKDESSVYEKQTNDNNQNQHERAQEQEEQEQESQLTNDDNDDELYMDNNDQFDSVFDNRHEFIVISNNVYQFKISFITMRHNLSTLINESTCQLCIIPLNVTLSPESVGIGFECTLKLQINVGVLEPRFIYSEKYSPGNPLLNINFIDKMYFMNTMSYANGTYSKIRRFKGTSILFLCNARINVSSILDNYLFKISGNPGNPIPSNNDTEYNNTVLINQYFEHDPDFIPNFFIKEKFFNYKYWDGIYSNFNINITNISIKILLFTFLKMLLFIPFARTVGTLYLFYLYIIYFVVICLPRIIKYNILNRNSTKILDVYLKPISHQNDRLLINHDWMFLIIYYLYPINWIFIIFIYSITLFVRFVR